MDKKPASAPTAIRPGRLTLGEQWAEVSIRSFQHACRLNLAAFEALCGHPLAAAQAAIAAAVYVTQTYSPLSTGLPGLTAEYAGDMNGHAEKRSLGVNRP